MSSPDFVGEDRLSLDRLKARLLAPHHLPGLATGTGAATIGIGGLSAISRSWSSGPAPTGAHDA